MEKKFSVKPIRVRLFCDECKVETIFKNKGTSYYKEKFYYICPKCGKIYTVDKQYPYLEYEDTVIPVVGRVTK